MNISTIKPFIAFFLLILSSGRIFGNEQPNIIIFYTEDWGNPR